MLSVALALLAGMAALAGSTNTAGNGPGPTALTVAARGQDDPAGRALLQEAEGLIAAYHAGQPRAGHTLRVVYFVPKDGEPFTNYEARVDRIVADVSDFYRDGFRRFGIETSGLPLEREQGKLVVHLVRGQLPASEYHYDSGDRTAGEMRAALKGSVDFDREYVLAFYALCHRDSDGRHVFNAPYYGDGGSSQKNGLCHVADCELLDPLLLTDTNHSIVYTEHYYPHVEQTVAKFNSWYLGGVAHELGHGLGLPHDDGGETEKSFGVSLMGAGNLNYRENLWGGGHPSYLGRASALQLAAHPLFTGSDRGRWDAPQGDFKSLVFSATNGTVRLAGLVTGVVPPYAVIAYVWPQSDQVDDHSARTFPCVLKDGRFTLDLEGLKPGAWKQWHLKLARLHVNGAAVAQEFHLSFPAPDAPDVADLNQQWTVTQKTWAVQAALAARDWGAAAARVEELAALAPASSSNLLENCRLEIALGRQDEPAVLEQIRQMAAAHQNDPNEENELAWLMVTDPRIKHPDLDLAEKLARRAVDGGQDGVSKGEFSDSLARVKFMQGKKEEAIVLEQNAVSLTTGAAKEELQKTLDSYKHGVLPDVK